jgi:hypothetical protein
MLQAHWNEFYRILSAGDPPLVLQLLAVNSIFLIFCVVRRMSGSAVMRPEVANMIQSLLLFANAAVLFQEQIFRAFAPYL